ncbi:MAG TPA: N-acetyltransferase [Devosiaceae bacterium]|jgi:predicted N-acetyltransferase YhbS|nr:N-acetyltransferase [Devosiaceae bacterium]
MNTPSAHSAPALEPPQRALPVSRLATPADDQFVEDLQALAFGPGRFARTAFRVRERFPIDKSLSLIGEIGGVPVSSVWMTPISVGGINGYLLGPLATDPKYRGLGAGKLLVKDACRMALDRHEGSFVLLVGDEPYYGPLGFARTKPGAIQFPGPVDPNRVLIHAPDPALAQQLAGPIAAFRKLSS